MCKLFKRKKTSKNKQQPIIVKAEIDYDKLADKLVLAMAKYQAKNAITEENIKNAVLSANQEFQKIEEEKPLTTLSSIMRYTLLVLYGVVYLFFIIACCVFCYDKAIHGVALKEWWDFPVIFACIAWLTIVVFVGEYKTKSNNSVHQHFSYIATMAALLLAILAL